jgi:hypothetical protein
MVAQAKKSAGCSAQTRRRVSFRVSISVSTSAAVKRRQKSPAVVGSGMRRAPRAFRKVSSVRRSSMSCRQAP